MNVDYIIVGLGLAGMSFAETLTKHQKTFKIFENKSQNSSLVAGGMYNPVILKRFTPVWKAHEQIQYAIPFYKELEKRFDSVYQYDIPIYRVFKSIEEQNNWFAASDKKLLEKYMVPKVFSNDNESIEAPYGYGKLINTGRIDTNLVLDDYYNELVKKQLLIEEGFDHSQIVFANESVSYKGVSAKTIVFCEGFGLKKNPYFNYLPLNGTKGELITIHAPELKVDFMIKAAVFVLPIGNDYYKVGATFNWTDKTQDKTREGRDELVKKLKTTIKCEFEIVDQFAGIRPTVIDRRPLIGIHNKYPQLSVMNGLGTRGVIIAPQMANKLFQHIENGIPLDQEVSIERFN